MSSAADSPNKIAKLQVAHGGVYPEVRLGNGRGSLFCSYVYALPCKKLASCERTLHYLHYICHKPLERHSSRERSIGQQLESDKDVVGAH